MKKGRPSKHQSKQIRKNLWPFFVRGNSPSIAIQHTGYDKKTVYKCYNEWEKLHNDDEKDFNEKIRLEKQRADIAYDSLLFELEEPLTEIKKEMKSYKNKNEPIPRYLFGYHLQFSKEIANIIEKRPRYV